MILLETEVTSTESSQHLTLSLERHPVIKIILSFDSWNEGSTCLGKKVFVIAITTNADANVEDSVRRIFLVAHNESLIPCTSSICLDHLRSLQSPIVHPAHPQSLF